MALLSHIRGLGWLHIIYGGLTCAAAVVLVTTSPVGTEPWAGYWGIVGRALFLLGPLRIIAGWALLKHRWWSRPLVMFASVIGLFEAPLGTLLAIYSFFVIFSKRFSEVMRDNQPRP